MKLVAFETVGLEGRVKHLGALISGDADRGEIIDITAATRALLAGEGIGPDGARRIADALTPGSMLGFIQGGIRSRDLAEAAVETCLRKGWEQDQIGAVIYFQTDSIQVLPAISDPPLLRDFMAFESHLLNVFPKLGREIPEEWYRRPVYYKGNPSAIGAHGQDIEIPIYAERLDFEFELAAVIGRTGVNITEEEALSYIYGYTIYNDFSAREIQSAEMTVGLGPAKGKDFLAAHVLGPVLVTVDELGDLKALSMQAFVNGEKWTDTSSAGMYWSFEKMISYASQSELVRVGEIFGSGTVGNGSGAEQGKWLNAGDVVELQVERIGKLRNRVVNSATNMSLTTNQSTNAINRR